MLDTGALSPEVKKLFAQVASHTENYKKAFARLEQAVDLFEVDREKVDQDISEVRTEIAASIKKLEHRLTIFLRRIFPIKPTVLLQGLMEGARGKLLS